MVGTEHLFSRYVEAVYPSEDFLEKRLAEAKKLTVYYGIDPTSPLIHLGHSVPLRLLGSLQKLGHKVILVFGDFTGMIGDPSGRDVQRKPLTKGQILENASTYTKQLQKILNFAENPPEIKYNSEWWGRMKLDKFFEIASHFTLAQLSERDLFQERRKKSQPVALSEFLYPILQGYDSVALDVDAEVGASDQTFNMLVGREMLKIFKGKEKLVITCPLLEGTDGRKMSKSLGNSIDILAHPADMFGKLMSIKDGLITKYLTLVTEVDQRYIDEVSSQLKTGRVNPMDVKKKLAYEVVKIYHDEKTAKMAQTEFERVFQKGERTSDIKTVRQSRSILPISYASLATVSGATTSISEAIRLAKNRGLKFNGEIIPEPRQQITEIKEGETIVDVGKRRSVKIIWDKS
ncbi:MAG: tyrosine--tRNA ligase [Candidatus Woykebacteria bacterium RBG_16_44_10]|uniref:Tyrosine--tRNA ligase n=1 Tax=Candidatus Woykebacteria bacterium RBG_16_44_10 TaxID=1802597 RepID=A0A1G1WFZ3_9BACT|nr:MAG: tyrosine--tRNA ligase [Candidatus Woykebacteria bacterium RBG_16_44_10]